MQWEVIESIESDLPVVSLGVYTAITTRVAAISAAMGGQQLKEPKSSLRDLKHKRNNKISFFYRNSSPLGDVWYCSPAPFNDYSGGRW